MATAYFRLSGWWGEIEAYKTDEQVYTAAQRKPMGENAVSPGIGVRRVMVVFARVPTPGPTEDVAVTHFDFLNLTNGNPDDTWTQADFDFLNNRMDAYVSSLKGLWHADYNCNQFRWYRVGPGIPKPNPPVNIHATTNAGTGSGARLPPQCAATITDRTGVRLEWGRKYMPLTVASFLTTTNGRIASGTVDVLASATDSLYKDCAAADFLPVVYGPTRQKVYSIESVQVDDIVDVVRRRRWDAALYKNRLPPGG